MPTISSNREFSTSKNIKLYLLHLYHAASSGSDYIEDTSIGQDFKLANVFSYPKYESASSALKAKWSFNKVPNLQEIPDLANSAAGDRDTIEITTLEDEYHEYADGLKNRDTDSNSLSFTFLYDAQCYDALLAMIKELNETCDTYSMKEINDGWEQEGDPYWLYNEPYWNIALVVLADGSAFAFRVKNFSLTLGGAGVNAALTFTLNCSIDGDIEYHLMNSNDKNIYRLAGVIDGNSSSIKYIGDVSTTSGTETWGNITVS